MITAFELFVRFQPKFRKVNISEVRQNNPILLKALMAGPFTKTMGLFKKKVWYEYYGNFYADPADLSFIHAAFQAHVVDMPPVDIPVAFKHSHEPIRGLSLPKNFTTTDWSFFIPRDTLEGKAVLAALAVERMNFQERSGLVRPDRAETEAELNVIIAEIKLLDDARLEQGTRVPGESSATRDAGYAAMFGACM